MMILKSARMYIRKVLIMGPEQNAAAADTNTLLTAKLLQSCPTLCDPIDSSPPVSPVHDIFQARVLEWGAIAFSENRMQMLLNLICIN